MTAGTIVILNGVPRAGKTSIAAVIQETFDGTWVNLGVDVAREATPPRYQPGIGLRPGEPDHPAAAVVPLLYVAWYDGIAAHSRSGLNVVADFGHYEAGILADCARRLDGLPAYFVGVRCPIDVIMERRTASPPGAYAVGSSEEPVPAPVQRWQDQVHALGVYDLEVDTSVLTPEECAAAIRERLTSPPTALRKVSDTF
jgi:chloramphenicol 3-O phosphotransferase